MILAQPELCHLIVNIPQGTRAEKDLQNDNRYKTSTRFFASLPSFRCRGPVGEKGYWVGPSGGVPTAWCSSATAREILGGSSPARPRRLCGTTAR